MDSNTNENTTEMLDELDTHYDVILTGTDLTSSLLAAACARAGHKVLHLDGYDRGARRYPAEWSTMSLFDLFASVVLLEKRQQTDSAKNVIVIDTAIPTTTTTKPTTTITTIPLHMPSNIINVQFNPRLLACAREILPYLISNSFTLSHADHQELINLYQRYYNRITACTNAAQVEQILSQMGSYDNVEECAKSRTLLRELNRTFSLDLTPRLLLNTGPMVELLIRSGVQRYLEFRKVAHLLTPKQQQHNKNNGCDDNEQTSSSFKIIEVPCSRTDVFRSKSLTLLDKRMLMKFFEICQKFPSTTTTTTTNNNDDDSDTIAMSAFESYLTLSSTSPLHTSPWLQQLVLNAVLMTPGASQWSTGDAIECIQKILTAVGRFGADRPWIVPDYGTDSLVQAFCRYAAVWGGTYCLGTRVTDLLVLNDDEKEKEEEEQQQQDVVDQDSTTKDEKKNVKKVSKSSLLKLAERSKPIEFDHLITGYQFEGHEPSANIITGSITHLITCSNRSIVPPDNCNDSRSSSNVGAGISILYLPVNVLSPSIIINTPVYVMESDHTNGSAPKGLWMQHFWTTTTPTTTTTTIENETKHSEVIQNELEKLARQLLHIDDDDQQQKIAPSSSSSLSSEILEEKEKNVEKEEFEQSEQSKQDTEDTLDTSSATLLSPPSSTPVILWSLGYTQLCRGSPPTLGGLQREQQQQPTTTTLTPWSNVYRISSPINELDFEHVITEAKQIFTCIYPGEEWFPEATPGEEVEEYCGDDDDDMKEEKKDIIKDSDPDDQDDTITPAQ